MGSLCRGALCFLPVRAAEALMWLLAALPKSRSSGVRGGGGKPILRRSLQFLNSEGFERLGSAAHELRGGASSSSDDFTRGALGFEEMGDGDDKYHAVPLHIEDIDDEGSYDFPPAVQRLRDRDNDGDVQEDNGGEGDGEAMSWAVQRWLNLFIRGHHEVLFVHVAAYSKSFRKRIYLVDLMS
jgi:hypothetical protein